MRKSSLIIFCAIFALTLAEEGANDNEVSECNAEELGPFEACMDTKAEDLPKEINIGEHKTVSTTSKKVSKQLINNPSICILACNHAF